MPMTDHPTDGELAREEVRRLVNCAAKGDNPEVVTNAILAALTRTPEQPANTDHTDAALADERIVATQICMGHGLVDVGPIEFDGRRGICLHPRSQHIPVGEPGTLKGEYWPQPGDVVIWIDAPEGADVIERELASFCTPATVNAEQPEGVERTVAPESADPTPRRNATPIQPSISVEGSDESEAEWAGRRSLVGQIADSPGAGHLSESEGLKQLGLLYNYREDDSRQFTRWQMLLAMNHGFGFAADRIAELEARLARAEEEVSDNASKQVPKTIRERGDSYEIGQWLFNSLRAFLASAAVDANECNIIIEMPDRDAQRRLVSKLQNDARGSIRSAARIGNHIGKWQGVSYEFGVKGWRDAASLAAIRRDAASLAALRRDAASLAALRSTPPEADLRAVDLLREARCPLCQTAAPEAFVSQCNRPECPYRSNTK